MASFVKPCSCINFHFLSHRKYRKYDWGPNSFLSLRSQSPLEWNGGRERGCKWPSSSGEAWATLGSSPGEVLRLWSQTPVLWWPWVQPSRPPKFQGSGEPVQFKVVFQSQLASENKNSQFHQRVLLLFLLHSTGVQLLGVWGWLGPQDRPAQGPPHGKGCLNRPFQCCRETLSRSHGPGGWEQRALFSVESLVCLAAQGCSRPSLLEGENSS